MAVVKERLGGEVWCVGSGITSAVDPSFRASASLFSSRASGKSSGRNPSRTNPGLKICGGGWRLVAGKSGETTPALQQGRRFGASSTSLVLSWHPAGPCIRNGLFKLQRCQPRSRLRGTWPLGIRKQPASNRQPTHSRVSRHTASRADRRSEAADAEPLVVPKAKL